MISALFLWSHRPILVLRGRGRLRGMNSRPGSLGAGLEAGCRSETPSVCCGLSGDTLLFLFVLLAAIADPYPSSVNFLGVANADSLS